MQQELNLRGRVVPIFRDPQSAFENAIAKGMHDPQNWMYMMTTESLIDIKSMEDAFKNINTRAYKSYRWS